MPDETTKGKNEELANNSPPAETAPQTGGDAPKEDSGGKGGGFMSELVDKFMEELRRERAVELSFEGHRFTDLRRWLLLDKAPYNQKKAVYFDRGSDAQDIYDDPQNAKVLNIREEVILQRNFSEKHYWFPFLRDDVDMFEEFKQNPGW